MYSGIAAFCVEGSSLQGVAFQVGVLIPSSPARSLLCLIYPRIGHLVHPHPRYGSCLPCGKLRNVRSSARQRLEDGRRNVR